MGSDEEKTGKEEDARRKVLKRLSEENMVKTEKMVLTKSGWLKGYWGKGLPKNWGAVSQ